MTALVVLAKAPRPGAVKTRLCPPLTPECAATFAAAALSDTLDLADRIEWSARVLALDVPDCRWSRPGWIHIVQRDGGLDARLGDAAQRAQILSGGAPVLLIGMDTPHLQRSDLASARDLLDTYDAVVGPAEDGGFWALGMRHANAQLTAGVPMSTKQTGAAQVQRLRAAGLSVAMAAPYRDIDDIDDARQASVICTQSRFVAVLRRAGAA